MTSWAPFVTASRAPMELMREQGPPEEPAGAPQEEALTVRLAMPRRTRLLGPSSCICFQRLEISRGRAAGGSLLPREAYPREASRGVRLKRRS